MIETLLRLLDVFPFAVIFALIYLFCRLLAQAVPDRVDVEKTPRPMSICVHLDRPEQELVIFLGAIPNWSTHGWWTYADVGSCGSYVVALNRIREATAGEMNDYLDKQIKKKLGLGVAPK